MSEPQPEQLVIKQTMEMAPVVEWLRRRGYIAVPGGTGVSGADAALLIQPRSQPMVPPVMVCEGDILNAIPMVEDGRTYVWISRA